MYTSVPFGLTPIQGLSPHGEPETSIGAVQVAPWFEDLLKTMSYLFIQVA